MMDHLLHFDDNVYNIIAGLTGQVKLSERIALTGDVSTILNGRQTVTFDGNSNIGPADNGFYGTNGTWWTGTLGLTFYLGKGRYSCRLVY
jgi:OmpA-OmpF porin, OOP family